MTTGLCRPTAGNIVWRSAPSDSREEFIIGSSRLINTVQIPIPLLASRASMSAEIKCLVNSFFSHLKEIPLWHHKSQQFVTDHTDNFELKSLSRFAQVKTIRDLRCTLTDSVRGFNTTPYTSVASKAESQPAARWVFCWIWNVTHCTSL